MFPSFLISKGDCKFGCYNRKQLEGRSWCLIPSSMQPQRFFASNSIIYVTHNNKTPLSILREWGKYRHCISTKCFWKNRLSGKTNTKNRNSYPTKWGGTNQILQMKKKSCFIQQNTTSHCTAFALWTFHLNKASPLSHNCPSIYHVKVLCLFLAPEVSAF